jgi:hypothetical protein
MLDGTAGGAELGTYTALAVLVGARRGVPRQLAAELAESFADTWGRWSARERRSRPADTRDERDQQPQGGEQAVPGGTAGEVGDCE